MDTNHPTRRSSRAPRTPTSIPVSIGFHRLIDELKLQVPLPAVRSEASSGARKTVLADNLVIERYPSGYLPRGIMGHLRFALRYEPIHLGVMAALFRALDRRQVEHWVRTEPTSKFGRRAWYLFELLTGQTLDVPDVMATGYIDLLDHKVHVVGHRTQIRRQRINDNLLGFSFFCPLVRRTRKIAQFLKQDLAEEARRLAWDLDAPTTPGGHVHLPASPLSSFPSSDDLNSSSAALLSLQTAINEANPAFGLLYSRQRLLDLHALITGATTRETGWRQNQTAIVISWPAGAEEIRFIPPKPEDLSVLMLAWMKMAARLSTPGFTDPGVAAAVASYALLFLRPFEDGNNRLHRFLAQDIFQRLANSSGRVLPLTAALAFERSAHENVLLKFFSSIRGLIHYTRLPGESSIEVHNDTMELYRYFDATTQVEHFYARLEQCVRRDMEGSLRFFRHREAAMRRIAEVVTMPAARAQALAGLLWEWGDQVPAEVRRRFPEVTDKEWYRLEALATTRPLAGAASI